MLHYNVIVKCYWNMSWIFTGAKV